MPYTSCEKKLYRRLTKQYGKKRAESIYHAMKNTGKVDRLCKNKE